MKHRILVGVVLLCALSASGPVWAWGQESAAQRKQWCEEVAPIVDGKLFARDHKGWFEYRSRLVVEEHFLDPKAGVKALAAVTHRLRKRIGTYGNQRRLARRNEALLAGHELYMCALLKSGDLDRAIARFRAANDPVVPGLEAHIAGVLGSIQLEAAMAFAGKSEADDAVDAAYYSVADRHLRYGETQKAVALLNEHFRRPDQCYDGVRYAVLVGARNAEDRKTGERWLDGFQAYGRRYGPTEKKGIRVRAALASGYLQVAPQKAQPFLKDLRGAAKSDDVRIRAYALPFLAYLESIREGGDWQAAWNDAITANEKVIEELKAQDRYGLTLLTPLKGFPDPAALRDLAEFAPGFVGDNLPPIPKGIDEADVAFLQSLRLDIAARHDALHKPKRALKVLAETKTGLADKDLQKQRCAIYINLIRTLRYADED